MSHSPSDDTTSAATLTAAIVGTWPRHRCARVCWVIPAETSPTISPDPLRTGATARIDGPSVPV
jgi:hypothetical protein